MCGINGFIDLSINENAGCKIIESMNEDLSHRGPNGRGIFFNRGVALGHTRLSIIDLSESANQPMQTRDRKKLISFNGEIYNFEEIKQYLINNHSCSFDTSSDTEVLLKLIEIKGIEDALYYIEGMYAFAYLDLQHKNLTLVRDRFGEKPLFYYFKNNRLFFSSELKPLSNILNKELTLNFKNLDFYLKKSYLPNDSSIYNEIQKVEPGRYVNFDYTNNEIKQSQKIYWDYTKLVEDSIQQPKELSYTYHRNNLKSLLKEKVGKAMISDVPLGAFLSGGYDSTCMVSMMQSLSNKKVKTFSIGFTDTKFNEAPFAKAIANHLGTDHEELYISEEELLSIIPNLPDIYSEPFADSSQIPTVILSRLTRSKVTVSISGDGGDEIFGGYGRYFLGERVKQFLKLIPLFGRKFIKDQDLINKSKPFLKFFLEARVSNFENKIIKLNEIISSKNDQDLFKKLSNFNNKFTNISYDFKSLDIWNKDCSYSRMAMTEDSVDYLPGDILQKVDLAGMSCSLETRIPILNHKLAEYVLSIPHEYLISGGIGKRIMKDIVHDYVPLKLMERPKSGFEVPLNHYLRHELKEYAEDMISYGQSRFKNELNFNEIQNVWNGHLEHKFNQPHLLWNLITFFAWHERYSK